MELNKVDHLINDIEEMREYFTDIQFERGLAILDYVQSKRYIKSFSIKKKVMFKESLKSSADRFKKTHEIEGIN